MVSRSRDSGCLPGHSSGSGQCRLGGIRLVLLRLSAVGTRDLCGDRRHSYSGGDIRWRDRFGVGDGADLVDQQVF